MTSLRELQLAFRDAILGSQHPSVADEIVSDGLLPAERVSIYRNNTRVVFANALGAQFPVVKELGGDDWFASIADRYRERHPTERGTLFHVGRHFASYLTRELAASPHDYFADVAHLEWACHEVLAAADAPILEPRSLARVAPPDRGRIQFSVRPGIRVVRSGYSILEIWRAHRVDRSLIAAVEVNRPQIVLVARGADGLELQSISTGECLLLKSFAEGMTLGHAMSTAIGGDDDFDPTAALSRLAQFRALQGFALSVSHASQAAASP